jgi:dipeptidyl aminopeptidase/acylaminoacyl peptidase
MLNPRSRVFFYTHYYTCFSIMKKLLFYLLLGLSCHAFGQQKLDKLSVENIMRDPKWIGTSPSGAYWSSDGKYLFFNWNPEKSISDSLYYISNDNTIPRKAPASLWQNTLRASSVVYNHLRTFSTYSKDGDLFLIETKTGKERRITQTTDLETGPVFSFDETKIVYSKNQNLYAWDIADGSTIQLTNFQKGTAPVPEIKPANLRRPLMGPKEEKKEVQNPEEKWLENDQLENFAVLKSRKEKKDLADSLNKLLAKPKELKNIFIEEKNLTALTISPNGRFITYRLYKPPAEIKNTIVPNYVTESGYTQDIQGRTKVGSPQGSYEFFIFDRQKDTVITVKSEQVPGITDQPDYVKDYPSKDSVKNKPVVRKVIVNGPYWNEKGTNGVVDIRSLDNKDRWLMLLDPSTGILKLLDRQRDEAWIGGPGIGNFFGNVNTGWLNENNFWFQSEATGYSHLYKINVTNGEKQAITSGRYEVQQSQLSIDKKYFYIITNEANPGEQQFYRLPVVGGKAEKITTMTGANLITLSPDEKEIAITYSYSNKPWELYMQENKPGSSPKQITSLSMSDEFKSYPWRDPELVTFQAADGATVYARLYRPAMANPAKPAVIFVHGAGYLQNAHKWWSSYFHEYMFNNLLADNGYAVLDIDYRGSAGYGRDWRTAIYRHMGGKDLSDQIDGVKYLVDKLGVEPKHIGLYGGSYGGFITLMAMFTKPGVFAAGAGLRSVTDWAHYSHGYTAPILNEPYNDSIAYKQSSPIYFAEGLKGHLLMCHGMVDENVHFQDIVRLSQRLIELGKDNWELAVYPMEDHGFVEPSSWTDEYKRIFKLFQTYLK